MACGVVAHSGAWPTAFHVRGVPGGVEYTWSMGAVRTIGVGALSSAGDAISVTVRAPRGGTIMPVLIQGTGLRRLTLSVPGARLPAAPASR
jgi:hypothetical protein